MINEKQARKFCKDEISLIENYEQAMTDTTQTWECHHRDEVRVLPSGMRVVRTMAELKENGRYYGCPANELIFLTKSEHHKLHSTKNNWSAKSEETRKKISEAVKKNPNRYWKGKKLSKEHLAKRSEKVRNSTRCDFGDKFKEYYNETHFTSPKLYFKEYRYYQRHGKCSWEVSNG